MATRKETTATVRVQIYAQDPLVEPGLVEIEIPRKDLETGPKDSQFVVVDLDTSSGVVYQPARFLPEENAFEALTPDDIRFHQINVFATARYALDMIEAAIGRQVHWASGPQLIIHPHYMQARNAFYSRELGALAFFYFDIPFKQGKVFTSLSHDVVAHELGHAALDGLKPLYLEAFHNETGAFHESFGDVTAMFSALTLPGVVEHVIEATDGDLRNENIASLLAEEFGYGIYGPGHFFLRNAGDPMTFSMLASFEVHDYSVLLTATIYEILTEFYQINRGRVFVVTATRGEGLNLRAEPSTDADVLTTLQEGVHVEQIGEPVNDGTRTWRPVRSYEFGEGWAADDFLLQLGEQLNDVDALMEATRHLRRMVYRGVNYLPPTSVTFRTFGQAMLAADIRAFPEDERAYREVVKRVFVKREIVYGAEELDSVPQIALEWDGSTEQRDLNAFIFINRSLLGIPDDPSFRLNYPTIHTIDLSWVQSKGAAPIQETLIEYSYSQEVNVMDFCSYFVHFGGTLVFDEHRQLVAHFTSPDSPGTEGQMIEQGLAFYQQLKERRQIKALTWRRPDTKPTDASYVLYRLPDGRGQIRQNVCTRFSAKAGGLPGRQEIRIDLPEVGGDARSDSL